MSASTWQLQEAKNYFSEVIDKAISEGPQRVSRRGEEVVVSLSIEEYNNLQKSIINLLEFFRNSPLVGIELDLDRDKS